ncbi:hypothetical protein FDECE_3218, partial [Fusarium decemcellulare]
MSHPIIFNGSLGLGLMLVGLGLNASLRPDAHLKSLEFPVPSEPLAKKFSHALMRIWGIRNISVGLLISIIWTTSDEKLMAKALGAALTLPITDGVGAIAPLAVVAALGPRDLVAAVSEGQVELSSGPDGVGHLRV